MDELGPGEVAFAETSKWCPVCKSAQMEIVRTETVPHWHLPEPLHATKIVWACPVCVHEKAAREMDEESYTNSAGSGSNAAGDEYELRRRRAYDAYTNTHAKHRT